MLGATLPSAGLPDFQAIEQGRKAYREAEARVREMPPRPPKPAVATAAPALDPAARPWSACLDYALPEPTAQA